MDDLISRQAAIKLAIDLDYESRGILKESKCREIENRYNMIPSAQPERKTGQWLDFYGDAKCSNCGFTCNDSYYLGEANYCPNCGADMREES